MLTIGSTGLLAWWQRAQLTWKVGRRSERGVLVQYLHLAKACALLWWLRHSATLVHFATLYRRSAAWLPIFSELGATLAGTLQSIAWEIVRNNARTGGAAVTGRAADQPFLLLLH